MLLDLKDFDYSARTSMDLVIKERLKKLVDSKIEGVSISFGKDIHSKDAEKFYIGCNTFDKCSDIRYGSCDVYGPLDCYCLDRFEFAHHVLGSEEILSYLNLVYNGLEDFTDDDLMELVLYKYEDDDPETEDVLSMVKEFDKAYRQAVQGETSKALSCDAFSAFIDDYMDNFVPAMHELTPDMVAGNIDLIAAPFVEGNETHTVRCGCYASREVRLYDRYRRFLPRKQRKKVDGYIRMFKHPQAENCKFTENSECTCVFYVVDEADSIDVGMEGAGFNILFERAILWLDENLPKLRKKYYREQEKVCVKSGSAAA